MTLLFRPTARGWIVASAGVVWILVAMVNRMVFPYLMGCGALALTGASLIGAALSLRGLSLTRGWAGDVSAGETVDLPLVITNHRRRRRQAFVIIEELSFAAEPRVTVIVSPLAPREERVITRRILAVSRGEFDVGVIVIRGGDPMGLFCRERRFFLPQKLLVYPGVEPLPDLVLSQSEASHSVTGGPVSATGASQEFYGVREYHPMDGLRYIHWRTSARFGQLMVREFERNAITSVGVVLDADEAFVSGHEFWSNLEYQIRAAASICRYCADLYCSFGLAASGESLKLVRPRLASDAVGEVMVTLARLEPGKARVSDALFALTELLPRGSVIFCLSLGVTRTLSEALDTVALQGMNVRWYCASRDAFAGEADEPGASSRTRFGERSRRRVSMRDHVVPVQLRPGMRLEEALV